MTECVVPRIVIGGVSSGAGKTVLSIGLMQSFKRRGLSVAPFKIGPDFIDPMFHRAVVGGPSRNLDSFLMNRQDILESFDRGCRGGDIAVGEGVMGLFDSVDATSEVGSTAEVAKSLRAPVILSVNVAKTARSAAAVVQGFRDFDSELNLAGVVLNMVGSKRHRDKVTEAVEQLTGVEVVGALPKTKELHLPERHLGLVPVHELKSDFQALTSVVEEYVDVERIIEIAGSAEPLALAETLRESSTPEKTRVGVFLDDAFRFYYADTLSQLETGANLIFIDSLRNKKLPAIDSLYIGGGFPEVYASKLEKNKGFRNSVYDFCATGGRVYGECGGLMYLGESISTDAGEFEMTGFLPLETVMQKRYVGMGYVINQAACDSLLAGRGEVIRGHVFHHSKARLTGKADFAFKTLRGSGITEDRDGMIRENVLASYMHVHPLGCKGFIDGLINPPPDSEIKKQDQ